MRDLIPTDGTAALTYDSTSPHGTWDLTFRGYLAYMTNYLAYMAHHVACMAHHLA